MGNNEILLTTEEVERLYKVSRQTQSTKRRNGEWKYIKDGKLIRYYKEDIEDWFKEQTIRNIK